MKDEGLAKVVRPTDPDVILGRGKPFQNHPGNQRMLTIVDKYRERYQTAERKEKHDIVEEVMGIITGNGGKFLRRLDYENYWIEVPHAVAYRKVGHAFRSKARKLDGGKKSTAEIATGKQRIEAPALNNNMAPSNMEEILLADLRMRRAALNQAEFLNNVHNMNMSSMGNMNNMNMNNMNMNLNLNNIAAMAAGSGLERFLLPSLYNNIAAAGFLQQGLQPGLMNPNLMAANSVFMGNFNPADFQKGPAGAPSQSQDASSQEQAPQDNTTAANVAPVVSLTQPQAPPASILV